MGLVVCQKEFLRDFTPGLYLDVREIDVSPMMNNNWKDSAYALAYFVHAPHYRVEL